MRAETQSEAEGFARGSLRSLRQRRDDQRVTRIDRRHRRADPEPRYCRTHYSGEGDHIMIVPLAQQTWRTPSSYARVACAISRLVRKLDVGEWKFGGDVADRIDVRRGGTHVGVDVDGCRGGDPLLQRRRDRSVRRWDKIRCR